MNTLVALPIAAAVPTAAPAMPVLHAAAPPAGPHPDAKLFALIDQFVIADRKYRALRATVDRMEDEIRFPDRGEMPEVLRWRPSDRRLGLPALYVCQAIPKPNWDCELQVRRIRPTRWVTQTTVVYKGLRGAMLAGSEYKVVHHYMKPSKQARRRADEIIEAFDSWTALGKPPRGFAKLKKDLKAADKLATKLENQVSEMRATTVDGMLAKVRAAHTSLWCKPTEIFDTGLDDLSGCAETMADSIFRDLQKLALAEAPLVPTAAD